MSFDAFSFALGSSVNGGGSPSGAVQSDWNQNDSSKMSYIKNRPFYTEETSEDAIFELGDFSDVPAFFVFDGYIDLPDDAETVDAKVRLKDSGQWVDFKTTFQGEIDIARLPSRVTIIAGYVNGEMTMVCALNTELHETSTNPPYVPGKITIMAASNIADALQLVDLHLISENITKIPQKYVATDWNDNDTDSTSFIKNRPFYDSRVPTNRFLIKDAQPTTIQGVTVYYKNYRLFDFPYTTGDNIQFSTISKSGQSVSATVTVREGGNFDNTYSVLCIKDSDLYCGITINEKFNGTEDIYSPGDCVVVFMEEGISDDILGVELENVVIGEGELKKIDEKFLPPKVNYSTEEHEVGTWIDGSKLYERTFVANIADSSDLEHKIEIEDTEIGSCVAMDCILIAADKQTMGQGIVMADGKIVASVSAFYERSTPTTGRIFTEIVNNEVFTYPLTEYVTIRYIKTS